MIVAIIALAGVAATVLMSWRNQGRQTRSAHALKIADMEKDRIDRLRDAMADFQSYGVTPGLDQSVERAFYALGTKIELLMNPDDSDYAELQRCLYDFLPAKTEGQKYSANAAYINVCQRILKREAGALELSVRRSATKGTI